MSPSPGTGETARRGPDNEVIALRELSRDDLDALFDFMREPASVHMAAFTARDTNDRAAFDAHMATIMSSSRVTLRAITRGDEFVGTIASFPSDDHLEVTYWVARSHWGRGVATRALALLVESVAARPLYARAASDNVASLRVLAHAGFRPIGSEVSFAAGRGADVRELILELA